MKFVTAQRRARTAERHIRRERYRAVAEMKPPRGEAGGEAAERRGASLLYGTNFSMGVQMMMKLAEIMTKELAGLDYKLSISETHHTTKLDAPSGTALTLRDVVKRSCNMGEIPIKSIRHGEAVGLHVLEAESQGDRILLTHESHSRRPFAEGAVRAAEWLASAKPGVYDFRDVFDKF